MSFLKEWLFGPDDFDDGEDEDLDPILDPIVEKRRKEKFSEPLIYNNEFKEKKETAPKVNKEEPKKMVTVKETEKPKPKPTPSQDKSEEYVMTQIISPFSGLRVSEEEAPIVKKKAIRKKKFRTNNDELIPVISPFYGPDEEEEEKNDLEETKEYKKFVEPAPAVSKDETQEVPVIKEDVKEKKNDEVIDSVENRLRNIASLTEETQDDLKIIEERTGKFKLDFKTEEDSLIDEIDDNMSLDELMNLYEKKFKE